MALYKPAQHLLKDKPTKGVYFIQSTTRVWVNSGETIVHYQILEEGADFLIFYRVIKDEEEQAPHEEKRITNLPWDGNNENNHIVKVIIFREFDESDNEKPLGSTSNNSDDADIPDKG